MMSTIIRRNFLSVFERNARLLEFSFWTYTNGESSRRVFASCEILSIEEQLKEVFKFRDSKISNWIIENKARALCSSYLESAKQNRHKFLRTLASQYAVQHESVCNLSKKLLCTEPDNKRRLFTHERSLQKSLTPPYHWLFVVIARLECGVKFLVDLRTDALELMSESNDTDGNVVVQQLNVTLQDLLLLWFSVGFLHLERVTWQSACDILQKVSDYEAIHPMRNWLDLKRRVGPYRRCYIFTHPSMPREPLVLLHTALCDVIPDSVKGIKEAETRILGGVKKEITFSDEDKSKIRAAIFYSITSTQKGLQGIELGNYLIKEVVGKILTEFPMVHRLSSLSPIPNYRNWLLEKMKQDITHVFTKEECESLKSILGDENFVSSLKKMFNTSLWTNEIELCQVLKKPLIRACAWYLYKEKRRNYALNKVANFHLRNGAVMWRINWMADTSPRGVANSCSIMVNYRYYLNETEKNSRNYIENYFVNASEDVISLAAQAGQLRT